MEAAQPAESAAEGLTILILTGLRERLQIVAFPPGCAAHPAPKRMMTSMDIELLVVPDCPNEPVAAAMLRAALDDVGLTSTTFRTTVIDTQQRAEQRGFTGSPTILIGGLDPFVEPGRAPALACRIYRSDTGTAGVPPLVELRQVIKRAADRTER
jgi:hypothetical protein